MVDDVDASIDFYTRHLGFSVRTSFAPAFAEVTRGNLRLLLSGPQQLGRQTDAGRRGSPHPADGTASTCSWRTSPLRSRRLRTAGLTFRNDVVTGPGVARSCSRTPPATWSSCSSPQGARTLSAARGRRPPRRRARPRGSSRTTRGCGHEAADADQQQHQPEHAEADRPAGAEQSWPSRGRGTARRRGRSCPRTTAGAGVRRAAARAPALSPRGPRRPRRRPCPTPRCAPGPSPAPATPPPGRDRGRAGRRAGAAVGGLDAWWFRQYQNSLMPVRTETTLAVRRDPRSPRNHLAAPSRADAHPAARSTSTGRRPRRSPGRR